MRSAAIVTAGVLAAMAVTLAAPGPARAGRTPPPGAPPDVAALYENPPVVVLVTMGIGSLIWERHGHIALCVVGEQPADDACYNYGTGDFAHPLSMAWGFFRANGAFWVSKSPPRQMLSIYEQADRTIWFQPLPLTDAQEQQVIAKLEHDILEPNRYYSYDHFVDNCTTRVRNVLDDAVGGKLRALDGPTDGRTFRELARPGFYGKRVPLLVTDIAMGRSTDRVPSYYERMFLPDYMREAATRLWHVQPIVMYERVGPPPRPDGPSGRVVFALIILVLTAPAWATRLWGRFQRTGLAIAVVPPVLLGLVLWFLAIVSPLPYVRWNESLLLFLPVDLALLFLAPRPRRLYARGRVAMLGLFAVLLAVGVLHQPLWAPLLWPLVPLAVVGFWPARQTASATQRAANQVERARAEGLAAPGDRAADDQGLVGGPEPGTASEQA